MRVEDEDSSDQEQESIDQSEQKKMSDSSTTGSLAFGSQ